MKLENNTLWNEAARSGLLFGLFSSLCLGAKEAAALSGSTFLIQGAGILLWAVEFYGCILLMKRCMLSLRDRLGAGMEDCYRLGKRIALLSGLILASVEALIILKMPQESLSGLLESAAAQLGASGREQLEAAMDYLPTVTFFAQWIYCYLYGTLLSSILSRYIFLQKFLHGPDEDADTQ